MIIKVSEERVWVDSENGSMVAEITFPFDETRGVALINHTFVDESLRGQGVAGKLMQALVEELERQNIKALPTCSYAVDWFSKHDAYGHLLAAEA